MAAALTLSIDPQTGDLSLDDGSLAWAPSAGIGLVVFTLRADLGSCGADVGLGVDWSIAATRAKGVERSLARELERATQWIVDAGFIRDRHATVTITAANRIAWAVDFLPVGSDEPRTVQGTR